MQLAGSTGYSVNDFLAVAAGGNSLARIRQADYAVRSQIQQTAARAGAGAVVTPNLQYAIGPDGQRYAVGGTVATTTRTRSAERPAIGITGQIPPHHRPRTGQANDHFPQQPGTRTPLFSDIRPPQLTLSPFEFAQLQEEQGRGDQLLNRLQLADSTVRNHENQHFFSAGGLAAGTPKFEFTTGPDGRQYAVAGEVAIAAVPGTDASRAARDSATIARAATAPGDASAQDVVVAGTAASRGAALYAQALQAGQAPVVSVIA